MFVCKKYLCVYMSIYMCVCVKNACACSHTRGVSMSNGIYNVILGHIITYSNEINISKMVADEHRLVMS